MLYVVCYNYNCVFILVQFGKKKMATREYRAFIKVLSLLGFQLADIKFAIGLKFVDEVTCLIQQLQDGLHYFLWKKCLFKI